MRRVLSVVRQTQQPVNEDVNIEMEEQWAQQRTGQEKVCGMFEDHSVIFRACCDTKLYSLVVE